MGIAHPTIAGFPALLVRDDDTVMTFLAVLCQELFHEGYYIGDGIEGVGIIH